MAETREVKIPDIGGFEDVDVVEVLVSVGDTVSEEQSLITLESDKASMEVPSPVAGVVQSLDVKVGDKVSEGSTIATLEVAEGGEATSGTRLDQTPKGKEKAPQPAEPAGRSADSEQPAQPEPAEASESAEETGPGPSYRPAPVVPAAEEAELPARVHAGPGVRRYARQLGVDLQGVRGTGRKGRILKEDVEAFVKSALQRPAPAGGAGLPEVPRVDFARFGPIDRQPLSRINKATGRNMYRSWVNVPHVTQFDEADITELEAFRKAHKGEAADRGFKLTFLPFLMEATAAALNAFPRLKSSLDPDGEHLIMKRYCHLGVAVDTEEGLVVPVIRDVDQKGLYQLAEELDDVSARARAGKLTPAELTGAVFTISSLGGIGGTHFTPIVNAPEVAVLGVARARMTPVYRGGALEPRLILPFGLSYDHRVIDGALGVRFTQHLSRLLSDIRRLLL